MRLFSTSIAPVDSHQKDHQDDQDNRGSDNSLRDVLSVLFATGIGSAALVDLVAPWNVIDRIALVPCLLIGVACIFVLRQLPWHRLPHPVLQFIPVIALVTASLAMAVSGGWNSPFSLNIALAVGFAAFIGPQRLAIPIAVLAGLARVSPALYSHPDPALAILMNDVPSYIGLTFMIAVNTQRMREHERKAAVAVRDAGTLRRQAERDPLTGLYNHRALMECIDRTLHNAASCAVVLLDIDNFKLFNDVYGHQAGDAILRHVAAALRGAGRQDDIAGRMGGDEFVVVLPKASRAIAEAVAARVSRMVADEPYRDPDGSLIPLTISTGVAVTPSDGHTRQELLAVADAAMYATKRGERSPRLLKLGGHAGDLLHTTSYGVLIGLVHAIGVKDHYTVEHSADVTHLALLLAECIGLDERGLHALTIAGPLHDVGKIGIPNTILCKPGRLTDEEMDAIRQHVEVGLAIVRGILDDTDVLGAIAEHHERWDGKGYPHGLRGEETSLIGRVMQVADAASAMRLDRPYRVALSDDEVVARLRAGAGTQFDPALVEPFIAAYLQCDRARVA